MLSPALLREKEHNIWGSKKAFNQESVLSLSQSPGFHFQGIKTTVVKILMNSNHHIEQNPVI